MIEKKMYQMFYEKIHFIVKKYYDFIINNLFIIYLKKLK